MQLLSLNELDEMSRTEIILANFVNKNSFWLIVFRKCISLAKDSIFFLRHITLMIFLYIFYVKFDFSLIQENYNFLIASNKLCV